MVLLDLGAGPATPPWLPLLMVGVLLGLLAFLYWSMRRNIGRISFDDPGLKDPDPAVPAASPSTPGE
jgi:hypothetical protein